MKDILNQVAQLEEPFAVATVVATWSSAPRLPGAALAVSSDGAVIGSVSVGCIEADIYARCNEVLDTGIADVVSYGVSDADACMIGMTCGGVMTVLIERVDPLKLELRQLAGDVDKHVPTAVVTVIDGPDLGSKLVVTGTHGRGTLGSPERDDAAVAAIATVRDLKSEGQSTTVAGTPVFIEIIDPPPHLIIFGAVEFAAALARAGAFIGYRVTVCDARPLFATKERFPDADEVVVAWPHEYLASIEVDENTALCVLTHDEKFDEPLLEAAVQTKAGYIGAMGSRRTHADRHERLRKRGLTEAELDRICSPIGLDLGASTPAETAISIVSEIILKKTGRSGVPLADREGPIHTPSPLTMPIDQRVNATESSH